MAILDSTYVLADVGKDGAAWAIMFSVANDLGVPQEVDLFLVVHGEYRT